MGGQAPGPICGETRNPGSVNDGTTCLAPSARPGPTGAAADDRRRYLISPAFKVGIDIPFSIAPGMTWDAYWRLIYDRLNAGIQQQANMLVARGNITAQEARSLVEGQRNRLVLELRRPLTPFGRLYSEIRKPAASLKSLETLVEEKGSFEAVLKSVGKTSQVVDRIGVISRVAGPALIVLDVTLTAIVIAEAPAEQRGRVAAREVGGTALGIAGGAGGMWAGCASFALFASPTLVVPVVGEISEGTACVVGGIVGGLGFGFAGRELGRAAGTRVYDFVTELRWNAP